MNVPPRARAILALLLILALGLAARAWGISLPGLTSDEAFSWRIVQYPPAEMVRRLAADVHPPLYFLLLQAWVGRCGDSLLAMRSLSAGLGLLAVVAAFAVAREAAAWGAASEHRRIGPGVLAAFLLAIHAGQVAAGRNVRMYTLGILLAGLTALLLLRALRRPERNTLWFLAYGLAAAGFALTHYYALFTIAGQVGFVLGWAAWLWRRRQQGPALRTVRGLAWGGVAAGLIFAPWLPAFLRQTGGVRESYWISPVGLGSLERALVSWGTGLEAGGLAPRLALVLVLGIAGWSAWRSGRAGLFLATQAAAPWLLAVGLSILSGRPIFLERYLVFAQFSLLALLGLAVPGTPSRRLWAAALLPGLVLTVGLWQSVARFPRSASAAAQAAPFLLERRRAGDLVLVDSPRALNRLLYWTSRSGADAPTVRCLLPDGPARGDRFSHLASLRVEDVLREEQLPALAVRRLWQARDSKYAPEPIPGWSRTALRTFAGGDGSWYTLTRAVREGTGPSSDDGPAGRR